MFLAKFSLYIRQKGDILLITGHEGSGARLILSSQERELDRLLGRARRTEIPEIWVCDMRREDLPLIKEEALCRHG